MITKARLRFRSRTKRPDPQPARTRRPCGLLSAWKAGQAAQYLSRNSGPLVREHQARRIPEHRLRQFFLENHMWSAHTVDLLAEEIEDIISINQGWLFGRRDEEDQDDIIHLTTFVDQGHFFPDQHQLEARLEFDRLLAGMSEEKRALLRRMKEAAEKGGKGN